MSNPSGKKQSIWTVSNVITVVRILLVPVFVAALLCPWPDWFGVVGAEGWKRIVAAAIFVLISCTDWLDGFLARRLDQVTDFGKFMDPLADKILVAAALIALVELGALPTWVVLVILAREFIVSGVRMMAAAEGVVIAASWLGKFKTVFQMIAIVLFTIKDSHMVGGLGSALDDTLWVVSWIVMIIALILTVASMIDYLVKAKDIIGLSGDKPAKAPDAAQQQRYEEMSNVFALAQAVVEGASGKGVTLATAESLTGGLIGSVLTAVPGASSVYRGGVVSYVDEVKHAVLGVDDAILSTVGAVSEETACQMARGARDRLGVDIAVSVTGIAGPGGAEPGKPVGTVWMGVATSDGVEARMCSFNGDRDNVRRQTVMAALGEFSSKIDSI